MEPASDKLCLALAIPLCWLLLTALRAGEALAAWSGSRKR